MRTFKEFTEEALRIWNEAGDGASVSTDMEFWYKPNASPPYRVSLTWNVWDSILKELFTASTPEAALALYREAKLPKKVDLSGVDWMENSDA